MRVIIAGGSGLVGRALSKSLADDGHEVLVLSRRPERNMARKASQVEMLKWDGMTGNGWSEKIEAGCAIVNMAGAGIADKRWSAERKKALLDSRVNSAQAILDGIEQAKVRSAEATPAVLVQASAMGFYGMQSPDAPAVDEDSPAGSDFLSDLCEVWEAASERAEELGVRRTIARIGLVLSTEGGALPKMALPFRLFAGGPVGSGKQVLSWIHMDDIVGAIRFLIDTPSAEGPYNLVGPAPLSNAEFGRAIGRALRRPAFMPAPTFMMKLIFGEMSTILLEGQRVLPKRLLEAGYEFRYQSLDAALEDLIG